MCINIWTYSWLPGKSKSQMKRDRGMLKQAREAKRDAHFLLNFLMVSMLISIWNGDSSLWLTVKIIDFYRAAPESCWDKHIKGSSVNFTSSRSFWHSPTTKTFLFHRSPASCDRKSFLLEPDVLVRLVAVSNFTSNKEDRSGSQETEKCLKTTKAAVED